MTCVRTLQRKRKSSEFSDEFLSSDPESENEFFEVSGSSQLDISEILTNMETLLKKTRLLTRLRNLNNVDHGSLISEGYLPLLCDKFIVGIVSTKVISALRQYPAIFKISKDSVRFQEIINTVNTRSCALNHVMMELRDRGLFGNALRGWRSECYQIRNKFNDPTLFEVERAASPLLGVRKYGVQINGFVKHATKDTCLWFQQRALSKPTWAGLMDNFVGGGVTESLSVQETAIKEAAEEAGVDVNLASNLIPAGSISFLHRTERGIHPNTEFVFDLELPEDFVPRNTDGEVGGWTLVPVDLVPEVICSEKFKITSVPVVIDFLVRRGFLEADKDLIDLLNYPLEDFYHGRI